MVNFRPWAQQSYRRTTGCSINLPQNVKHYVLSRFQSNIKILGDKNQTFWAATTFFLPQLFPRDKSPKCLLSLPTHGDGIQKGTPKYVMWKNAKQIQFMYVTSSGTCPRMHSFISAWENFSGEIFRFLWGGIYDAAWFFAQRIFPRNFPVLDGWLNEEVLFLPEIKSCTFSICWTDYTL